MKFQRVTIRLREDTKRKAVKWAAWKRMSMAAVFDVLLANMPDEAVDKYLRW